MVTLRYSWLVFVRSSWGRIIYVGLGKHVELGLGWVSVTLGLVGLIFKRFNLKIYYFATNVFKTLDVSVKTNFLVFMDNSPVVLNDTHRMIMCTISFRTRRSLTLCQNLSNFPAVTPRPFC